MQVLARVAAGRIRERLALRNESGNFFLIAHPKQVVKQIRLFFTNQSGDGNSSIDIAKGFVRMAISTGVPIVPVATIGGPDSMPVLARGRGLAKAMQLDRIARLKMFPIAISAPWGIAPAALPEIPLPTKIRTAFEDPISVDNDPERAGDDEYVERKYEEVRQSIQAGMDRLARRRRFPIFG